MNIKQSPRQTIDREIQARRACSVSGSGNTEGSEAELAYVILNTDVFWFRFDITGVPKLGPKFDPLIGDPKKGE